MGLGSCWGCRRGFRVVASTGSCSVGVSRIRSRISRQCVFNKTKCRLLVISYTGAVPKLWNETIETHRTAVRDSILNTTVALASEHGLLSVTMSRIAKEVGIGRATLYKYFPDVEAILLAQHDRQVASQLEHLHAVNAGGDPGRQLEQVLRIHAMMIHEHHDTVIASVMRQGGARGHQEAFLQEILNGASQAGAIRTDMNPQELARFCLHALSAAAEAPSDEAVNRLVQLTMDGLRGH